MNRIKLYLTLFITSMLFSTTACIVFAADSQTVDTVVTCNQPQSQKPDDNTTQYEVTIPSSQTIAYGSADSYIDISITGTDTLPDNYTVYVDVDESCFETDVTPRDCFRLYTTDQKYYRSYYLMKGSMYDRLYYYSSDNCRLNVAKFTNEQGENKSDSLILVYREDISNDNQNYDGGTYTGTIHFNIYGKSNE